jgi:aminopeptidase N
VTCKDWFQLTLKEGLTVFRDQQFSGDMMGSPQVKRIEDVKALRARQFSEDAGPMSHPIRPDSYISMDNFYTSTVYSKGAEVIRMYHTLLTPQGFRKGMDLYFKRHDGSAVTCDDFRSAMADANNVNMDQFGLWYSTAGTPNLTWGGAYDKESEIYHLTLAQTSKSDTPLHIPVSVGLLDKATGVEIVPTTVLELKETTQTFEFKGIKGEVVPSILRDFSAPVKLVHVSGEEKEEDLAFLAAFDANGFNKWEAGQKLYTNRIFQVMNTQQTSSDVTRNRVMEAFGRTLRDSLDFSIKAYALSLPAESSLSESLDSNVVVDPVAIHLARDKVKMDIARTFERDIRDLYNTLTVLMDSEKELVINAESIGRRRLRNVLLDYLSSIRQSPEEEIVAADLALNHFQKAKGMTDKYAALVLLASMDGKAADARDAALHTFYKDANGDALVLNKWFTAQSTADLSDVLERVKSLTQHPDFTVSNPNRFRSLVSAFTMNHAHFHASDGSGYKFIADMIIQIDKLNPQVSSRLATSLINWKKYGERGSLMKGELQRLASLSLSDDLFEVVSRGLQ